MSNSTSAIPNNAPSDGGSPEAAPPRPVRSFARQVLGDTFMRTGARMGLIWIGFLAMLAVFAPFIASSHPYVMKVDGELSSPLLEHLTPFDVILVAAFIAAVAVYFLPRSISGAGAAIMRVGVLLAAAVVVWQRWISPGVNVTAVGVTIAVAIVALALGAWRIARAINPQSELFVLTLGTVAVLSFGFVSPPDLVVYEKYRELEAEGKVDWIVRAPIPYSPNDRVRDRRGTQQFEGPWWASPINDQTGEREYQYNHLLGQDPFEQDIASRMIHASRISLAIGFIGTGIAVCIGIVIGGLMGYFAGVVDLVGMRLVEVFEFIPTLYLLLMFVAFFPGDYPEILPGIRIQRLYMIMVIIGLVGWVGYARYIRAEFFKLRRQDFVQAAIACGLPLRSILFRHMLPNGVTPVLVSASFGVAGAIIAEATLSFVGLGLTEDPSWGQLLHQAARAGSFLWWIATFPGLAIFLTVFSYNMIGEAMRDAIDPHTRRLQRAGA